MPGLTVLHDRSISIWGLAYPGSLLHLVSYVFESAPPAPLLGMEWYTHQVRSWDHVTFHVDHACTSHGGFDDHPGVVSRLAGYVP